MTYGAHCSWQTRPTLLLLVLCLVMPLLAGAAPGDGQLTIYRCTDAKGQLSLRDTPCLPSERQQATEMQRPQDPPARPPGIPTPVVAPVATIEAAPDPPTQPVRAAPPVYRCTTPDGEQYTSNSADGNPRWVPLWTLGYYPVIVGPGHGLRPGFVFDSVGRPSPKPPYSRPEVPDRPQTGGMLQGSGTWIRDACTHIPQAEVCDELRNRHSTLSRRYNSALQSERREIDNEKRRIDKRLTSECTP